MANRSSRTTEKDAVFFNYLAETANVSAACSLAGYPRTCVYEWKRDDPEFEKRWVEAEKLATAQLEAEMYRRAVFGTHRSEPLMHRGKIVAYKEIDEYSDTLAIFLAKARDPEKYRERVDFNVNWRHDAKHDGLDPETLLMQMRELIRGQLEATSDVIDVTPLESNNDAIRAVDEIGEDSTGS
jgi:hypothetical protein